MSKTIDLHPLIKDSPAAAKSAAPPDDAKIFLHNIINSVADPIFVKDEQHRIIEGNDALWALLGRPRQQVIGKSDYDFFPKEEADIFWQKDQEAFASGKVNINVENITDAAGDVHVISTKKSCLNMPGGRKILVGVIRDITELKRMQEKLKESDEARLQSIMDHSGRMVYIKDIDGRYLQANKEFLKMINREEKDVIGKTNYDFFPKEFADIYKQNDEQVIATGQPIEFEQATPFEGRTYMAVKFPLYDTDNKIYAVCGITSDITERKQAEQQLKETMEKLIESNIELERFAYICSHDLNSPLRMITQHLERVYNNPNNVIDEASRTSMGFVMDGAKRMRRLIDGLLEYSMFGFSEKMLEPVDCNKLLAAVLTNLSVNIEERHARVTHDALPIIMADEIQLMQLFQNLIANAIKFCSTEPHIHVSCTRTGAFWTFGVRDNGIGIAPHNMETIFQIFKRIHTEEHYPGIGIGLAVCERVVKNHGGRIWVESELGKGAVFFFTLPA